MGNGTSLDASKVVFLERGGHVEKVRRRSEVTFYTFFTKKI